MHVRNCAHLFFFYKNASLLWIWLVFVFPETEKNLVATCFCSTEVHALNLHKFAFFRARALKWGVVGVPRCRWEPYNRISVQNDVLKVTFKKCSPNHSTRVL